MIFSPYFIEVRWLTRIVRGADESKAITIQGVYVGGEVGLVSLKNIERYLGGR
jgi:hypothetical protein